MDDASRIARAGLTRLKPGSQNFNSTTLSDEAFTPALESESADLL